METPLIVLLDAEAMTVSLFGAYNKTISLHDFYLLKPYLLGRDVLYVSDATETSGEEVLQLAASVAEQFDAPTREAMYVRSTLDGYQRVPDIKLTFNGPKDAKAMEKLGWDVFDRSPQLSKMLRTGQVEILTESEARNLRKPKKNLAQAKEDQLNSMLIDNHEAVDDVDNIFTGDNDIDAAEDKEIMTEAEALIRQGIGRRE